MGNSIGRTKQLQKLHNIPNHWFKDTLNEEENYNFYKLGVHHKSCNGTNIEDVDMDGKTISVGYLKYPLEIVRLHTH